MGWSFAHSSWLGPFPPPAPRVLQWHLCSPASQVLQTHLTPHRRSSWQCRLGRSPGVPGHRGHPPYASRIPMGFDSLCSPLRGCLRQSISGCASDSRFSRLELRRMRRVYDSAVPTPAKPGRCGGNVAFPRTSQGRRTGVVDFGAQWLACVYPLPMLHPPCCHDQRTGRGQSYWLGLLCRTLSFSVPSRFIPALSIEQASTLG